MLNFTFAEIELRERIKWLIKLRWLFIIFALITIWIASSLSNIITHPLPLYIIILILICSNLFFSFLSKRIYRNDIIETDDEKNIKQLVRFENRNVNFQVSFDILILAFLIFFSGGTRNPFIFYFIFHMIISSIILSRKAAYVQASLAIILMSMIMILEYNNIIFDNYIVKFIPENTFEKNIYYSGILFVFTTTLYLSVFMGTSIVKKLRKKEEELLLVKESLEMTVKELRKVNEKLRETDRLKSEYVMKVTHELKSPLATIKSCLKVITDGFIASESEKLKDLIVRAENKVDDLLSMVSDLLRLSFIKAGKRIATSQPLIIKELISNTVNLFYANAEEKNLSLRSDIQPSIPAINGDKENVEILLTNLISNAVKYTPDNGTVEVKAEGIKDGVRIEVADSGLGISEEDIPRLFEDFFRTTEARKIDKSGTGLGLSIVKQIIKQHNGNIKVFSKLGKGTTFVVELKNIINPEIY